MLITIVGGCLTQQANVSPSDLYHQQLTQLLQAHGYASEVTIVRSERLATCVARVQESLTAQPAHWLVFHLRTEPLLRLIKLFYRYHDAAGRPRQVLNRGTFSHSHDPLADRLSPRGAQPLPAEFFLKPAAPTPWRELNGWLGTVIGNRRRALSAIKNVVAELKKHADAHGARLLLVGPPHRPASGFENRLAAHLDHVATAWAAHASLPYVRLFGEAGAGGEPLVGPNHIHISIAGHRRIAERLAAVLQKTEPAQPVDARIVVQP
jgi:hypothetical protein